MFDSSLGRVITERRFLMKYTFMDASLLNGRPRMFFTLDRSSCVRLCVCVNIRYRGDREREREREDDTRNRCVKDLFWASEIRGRAVGVPRLCMMLCRRVRMMF